MKKKNVIIFTSILLLLLLIVFIITYIIELLYFSVALGVLFVLLLFCFIIYIKSDNEFDNYIKLRNKYLKHFEDRIDKKDGIPSIKNKDIILVNSINDLLKINDNKILYKNDNDSSFFMNISKDEVYVYILKINDSVISPTWELINFMKNDNEEVLDELEHTIEYKLDELHSYKIKTIRNTSSIKIVDGLGVNEKDK